MPESFSSLDELARRWREEPVPAACAALAEGLRKRGAYAEAAAVAREGLGRRPADLPCLVVLSRILLDQGEPREAEAALRVALATDPDHPGVLRALWQFEARPDSGAARTGEESDELLFTDDDPAAGLAEPLLTESLAGLYHRQGHLDRAAEVYSALVSRDPANAELRARRDSIAAEVQSRRPRPYDAALSGGRPLREWLAEVAAVAPPATGSGTAYDAFYQTSPAPPPADQLADFETFQHWLKGLDR